MSETEDIWAGLKIAAENVKGAFTEFGAALAAEVALMGAAFAHHMGVGLMVSTVIPEDQAMFYEGRIVVGTKVMFVLEHPDLKGWDLAEAWIAHKIDLATKRALARHERRCDDLDDAHDRRPYTTVELKAHARHIWNHEFWSAGPLVRGIMSGQHVA